MPDNAISLTESRKRLLGRQVYPALIVGSSRKVLAANAAFRARFTGGADPAGRFCFQLLHQSRPPCVGAGGHCPLEMASTSPKPVVHRHLACLTNAYEQVTARRLPGNGESSRAFLLVSRPLAPAPNSWFLTGGSIAVLRLLDKVALVASDECAVQIRGEPGTGRACVGRLLHDLSPRTEGPFVPADCSAVDAARLEEVLWGRPEAADEGRASDRGLYAAAAGGTLFLREPQLLPQSLQRRVGLLLEEGTSACRWIFALDQSTSSPRGHLEAILSSARSLLVPPLRDRMEDLPLLLETLVRRFGGANPPAVDPAVPELLAGCSFPGNLRELECLVERACLVANGGVLRAEHFRPDER